MPFHTAHTVPSGESCRFVEQRCSNAINDSFYFLDNIDTLRESLRDRNNANAKAFQSASADHTEGDIGNEDDDRSETYKVILTGTVCHLKDALNRNNFHGVQKCITSDELYPDTQTAVNVLKHMTGGVTYHPKDTSSTGTASAELLSNISFMYPFSRYTDILTQQSVSLFLMGVDLPENVGDIATTKEVCAKMNVTSMRSILHKRDVERAKLLVMLKRHPLFVIATTEKIEGRGLHLQLPFTDADVLSSILLLNKQLLLCDKPELLVAGDRKRGRFFWEKRVFDYAPVRIFERSESESKSTLLGIDKQNELRIDVQKWRALIGNVRQTAGGNANVFAHEARQLLLELEKFNAPENTMEPESNDAVQNSNIVQEINEYLVDVTSQRCLQGAKNILNILGRITAEGIRDAQKRINFFKTFYHLVDGMDPWHFSEVQFKELIECVGIVKGLSQEKDADWLEELDYIISKGSFYEINRDYFQELSFMNRQKKNTKIMRHCYFAGRKLRSTLRQIERHINENTRYTKQCTAVRLIQRQLNNLSIEELQTEFMEEVLSDIKKFTPVQDTEEALFKILKKLKRPKTRLVRVHDISSEMAAGLELVRHHVKFCRELHERSVLNVQVTSTGIKGGLAPVVSMVNISGSIDICLMHSADPLACFKKSFGGRTQKSYHDIEHYQSHIGNILSFESISDACTEPDTLFILNIPMTFNESLSDSGTIAEASFDIRKSFMKQRRIRSFSHLPSVNKEVTTLPKDLFCVRVKCENVWTSTSVGLDIVHNHLPGRNIWCGHGILKGVEELDAFGGQVARVQLTILTSNFTPPQALFQREMLATLEIMEKQLPDRNMEQTLDELSHMNTSALCREIVLGGVQQVTVRELGVDVDDLTGGEPSTSLQSKLSGLPTNNDSQKLAIENALTKNFSLIQGPPGTGKTITGVKIAYWFHTINREINSRDRVLYCAPTNNAVDVAAKLMMTRFGNACPKILRIYSQAIEDQDYPVPRDFITRGSRAVGVDNACKLELHSIALHRLIRSDSNSKSQLIRQITEKFSKNLSTPEKISDVEIDQYRTLTAEAAAEELLKYHVIFCTCAVSSRMLRNWNVGQCIVDECGMCKEPESLIPLVSHPSVKQVVLIGDHKQLRPIVKNNLAKKAGLEISLFERYATGSFKHRSVMLNEQYRMHEGICKFPSDHFYDGELKTSVTVELRNSLWPNPSFPVVFCHIKGEEETQYVTTTDSHENSKSNQAQCLEAVAITLDLLDKHKVGQNDVVILSQYKAQVKKIKYEMESTHNVRGVQVQTVIASQGNEWDYVILSTVRSLPTIAHDLHIDVTWIRKNIGFLTDEHQINVALSRARKGLIVIGDTDLLKHDPMWNKFIELSRSEGSIVQENEFPWDTRGKHKFARPRPPVTAKPTQVYPIQPVRKGTDGHLTDSTITSRDGAKSDSAEGHASVSNNSHERSGLEFSSNASIIDSDPGQSDVQ